MSPLKEWIATNAVVAVLVAAVFGIDESVVGCMVEQSLEGAMDCDGSRFGFIRALEHTCKER